MATAQEFLPQTALSLHFEMETGKHDGKQSAFQLRCEITKMEESEND